MSEISRALRGEEVTARTVGRALAIGAAAGAIGGASTHLASNVSKGVSSEIAKAATRVSVQATSTAATDAGLQYIDKGEINTQQLLLNTVGSITVSTTAEVTQSVSRRTNAYTNRVNNQLIDENIEKDKTKGGNPEELKQKLNALAKDLNSLPPNVVEENVKNVNEHKRIQAKINDYTSHKAKLLEIHSNENLSSRQKAELRRDYIKANNLPRNIKVRQITRNINILQGQAGQAPPKFIDSANAHFLQGDRSGQIAFDLTPANAETGERGAQRAIFEKHGGKYVYADHTLDHDYKGCRTNVGNLIKDPFAALRPEQINRDFAEEEPEECGHIKMD